MYCFFQGTKEENFPRMSHFHIFNPKKCHHSAKLIAFKKGTWCSHSTRFQNQSCFASRALDWEVKRKLPKTWRGECFSDNLGGWRKFHYFSIWKKNSLWRTNQKAHWSSIYRKHKVEISPRIQRLVCEELPHTSHLMSQYRKGMENSTGQML